MKHAYVALLLLTLTTGMWGQTAVPAINLPDGCSWETMGKVLTMHCDPPLHLGGDAGIKGDFAPIQGAEPMDVPAVIVVAPLLEWPVVPEMKDCSKRGQILRSPMTDETKCAIRTWKETCADKHRILLTAENGDKHCILFPRTEQSEIIREPKDFQVPFAQPHIGEAIQLDSTPLLGETKLWAFDGKPPECPFDKSCRSKTPKSCCPGQ